MEKYTWVKELVSAEQKMEESGIIDFSAGFDPAATIKEDSIEYLKDLKTSFVESASTFNQLKGTTLGNIKIYGISKTIADFMLFRNGYKLIFSLIEPGKIRVSFNHIGLSFIPGEEAAQNTDNIDQLIAKWGAFGQLQWHFKEQPIKLDYLIRYYMTRFVRESAK